MANGQELDLVGVRLNSMVDALMTPLVEKFCECIASFAQQPGSKPCETFPFHYNRSIVQASVCFTATTVFQVPKGMTGVITRIAMQERYPGTLYGAKYFLIINDSMSPEYPMVDHDVGAGIQDGQGTRICLEEQDMVSILLQCSWQPAVFVGMESTFQQTLFTYDISGYYQFKEV